jgi:acyl carrier protein
MGVRDDLRRFIADAFLIDDFGDDDSFVATGIVDSLGIMQVVAFLEQEYGLRVDDSDLVPENFDSLSRVAAFVERSQPRRSA